jgi:glycosyltransferase involved in cell wall biosynthesis
MDLISPETKKGQDCGLSVVVAHPAQQHSYHLARAIKKREALAAYVTTIYFQQSRFLYRVLISLLDKENTRRLRGRQSSYIESRLKQFNEIRGLVFLFSARVVKNQRFLGRLIVWLGDNFGRKVARYVNSSDIDILICFDTYALSAFEGVNSLSTRKVLDMSSIPLERICCLIEEHIPNGLDAQKSLNMTKSIYSDAMIAASKKEILLASYFLVASYFSKKQLVEVGVNSERIHVIPYGVDLVRYSPKNKVMWSRSKKITFLFVGRMTAVKGFYVLVEALSRMPAESFKCLLVGDAQHSKREIEQLSPDFEYLGPVVNDDMPDIYGLADVLVAPSLYDGFGLAVLEAMASGLGVICSRNVGASDLVVHGKTGLLVDPNNVDDLRDNLQYVLDNPAKVAAMKIKARLQAENYSWETYDKAIADATHKINLAQ